MLARNARLFTFDNITLSGVEEALATPPWTPCGSINFETSGFVPTVPNGPLVRSIGDFAFFAFRNDTKILPPCVINDETDRTVRYIEAIEKCVVGRKRRRDIREDVVMPSLLAKAFVRHTVTRGWFDFIRKVLVIDAAPARAGRVIEEIVKRAPVATFLPWNPSGTIPAPTFLSKWLEMEPVNLMIDRTSRLVGADKQSIRIDLQNAAGTSAKLMLENSMLCSELAMTHEKSGFVIDQWFGFKRIFMAGIKEDNSGNGELLPEEKADAELILSALTVREIADAVEVAVNES